MFKFICSLLVALGISAVAVDAAETAKPYADVKDPENTLLLKLKDGDVLIQMFPEDAPNHVARIKQLVRQGFYDGLKFHRVIDGFMAQTGDPRGNGTGGSGKNLKAEFNNRPHKRGAVSMARAASPDSADSQFLSVLTIPVFLTASIRFGDRLFPECRRLIRSSAAPVPTVRFTARTKLFR